MLYHNILELDDKCEDSLIILIMHVSDVLDKQVFSALYSVVFYYSSYLWT